MVAIDAIEQMHAKAFNLVGANSGKNSRTSEIEVLRDFACIERAHVKICPIAFCIEWFSITGDAERGG
jgi:hypothetical protein